MKSAAQLYTIRDYLKNQDDILKSFTKIREIGYDTVQLSGLGPFEPKTLKAHADSLGINILATHIPYQDMCDKFEKVVEDHKTMGCTYVGIGGFWGNFTREGFIDFAKKFDELAYKFEEHGLKLTYHNHHFEFVKYGDKTAFELLTENSKKFQFLIDTHWIQRGGGDVADWIYRLKDRIEIIHFKDFVMTYEDTGKDSPELVPHFAEIFEGNLNWKGIIKACDDAGITHAIVEQDDCYGRNPFDSLKISYENLKKANIM